MSPPTRNGERADDDTLRTHIDEVSKRVEAGFRQVNARIGESNTSLRERIELKTQASLDRFTRHEKDDERRLAEMATDIRDLATAGRESQREVNGKLDKLDASVNAMALKEAASTGKLAGVVAATMTLLGLAGWLLDRFVLPH